MSLLKQIPFIHKDAVPILGETIKSRIKQNQPYSNLVFLCIGTDRSTGDALGPLVGTYLQMAELPHAYIWGTLEHPVHALNLSEFLQRLGQLEKPLVIAIDASLGKPEHVGQIQIVNGALIPGAAVRKILPPVGDFNIKGVVNFISPESPTFKETRLFIVMQMAGVISSSIQYALQKSKP